MTTSSSPSFLLFAYLLCILFFFFLCKDGNAQTNLSYHTIEVNNLLPSTSCKYSSKDSKNSATLKVVHKHGPCIQTLNNRKNANFANISEILRKDGMRVNSIHSKLSRIPAKIGLSLNTYNYVATIGLGTPKKDLPFIFDTGSDLSWAKCMSTDATTAVYNFDPTMSTSYANVSCNDPLCSSNGGPNIRCQDSTCNFLIQYPESTTGGFLAHEKLTIGDSDKFDKFYFGCSQNSEKECGDVAGLLGLGPSKLSLISQTSSKYNNLFSYCLPTETSTGFLSFGSVQSKSPTFVPLDTTNPYSNLMYFLNLTGITVGDQKLSIPTSVFTTVGTIIDSATVIIQLPPMAYSALKSAFQDLMSQYPMANPTEYLDTCFDLSNVQSETMNVPKIVFTFNEVTDLEIPKDGIFFGNNLRQMCLAFVANNDPRRNVILGNVQQRTLEVIYDINGGRIGFANAACT